MPSKDPEKRRESGRRWRASSRGKAYLRAYNKENADRYREKRWKKQGIRLTNAEREQLFQAQDGRCAMCRQPEIELGYRLHVDHDHATGRVRGLLCGVCNWKVLLVVEKYSHLIPKAEAYLTGAKEKVAN